MLLQLPGWRELLPMWGGPTGCSVLHKTLIVVIFIAETTSHCPARWFQSPQKLFVSISLLYIWYTLVGDPNMCPHILPYSFPAARSWGWWWKPSPTIPVPQKKVVGSGCWSNLEIGDIFLMPRGGAEFSLTSLRIKDTQHFSGWRHKTDINHYSPALALSISNTQNLIRLNCRNAQKLSQYGLELCFPCSPWLWAKTPWITRPLLADSSKAGC